MNVPLADSLRNGRGCSLRENSASPPSLLAPLPDCLSERTGRGDLSGRKALAPLLQEIGGPAHAFARAKDSHSSPIWDVGKRLLRGHNFTQDGSAFPFIDSRKAIRAGLLR